MSEGGIHVLFVEDDQDLAEMYRFRLERDGCIVTVAHDGRAGLDKAIELIPDAILLDIQLPKLDGLGVLDALWADPSTAQVPTIVFSNRDDLETIEAAVRLGATDYVVKHRTLPALLSHRLRRVLAEGHSLKSRLPLLLTARPALRR